MLGSRNDHEVRIYVSNGAVAHFTIGDVKMLYASWQMWVFVSVGFLIMSTGHPVTLPQFDSFTLRLGFWVIALLIYVLVSIPYMVLFDHVWQRWIGGPIPLIVMSPPVMLFSTWITIYGLVVLFEPDRSVADLITWQMNLRNLFVSHVFETVAILWLIPTLRSRHERTAAERTIALAGRTIPMSRVLRVKAAEHYLEVYAEDGCEILRERMSTFLEQVSPEDGIQTHRSHWVARGVARTLNGAELELASGDTVPVARGRLKQVQSWMDTAAQDQMQPDVGGGGFFSPAQRS